MKQLIARQLLIKLANNNSPIESIEQLQAVFPDDAQDALSHIKLRVEAGEEITPLIGQLSGRDKEVTYNNLIDALYSNGHTTLVPYSDFQGLLQPLWDTIKLAKTKLIANLSYFLWVLATATVVASVAVLFVLPQYGTLFDSFGGTLPGPTRFVLGLTNSTLSTIAVVIYLLLIAALIRFFWQLKKKESGNSLWEIPFSKSIKQNIIEYLVLAYELLLLDVEENKVSRHQIVLSALSKARKFRSQPDQLSELLSDTTKTQLTVAEKTGTLSLELEEALNETLDRIQASANQRVKFINITLKIILILVVWALVSAIYLPIFHMGSII